MMPAEGIALSSMGAVAVRSALGDRYRLPRMAFDPQDTRMTPTHRAFARAMACAVLLAAGPASAQNLASGKVNTGTPTFVNDQNVPLQLDANGALKVTSGGSAASGGSVTAAGTNGTQAQAVQGINGGVPQNVRIDQTTPGTTNRVYIAAAQPAVASTVALAANGTVSGTYFSGVGADGTFPYAFAYFTCSAFADQAGTLFVESSLDNATFFPRNGAVGTAVAANSSVDVKVPLSANVMRCRYVNGSTAQTKFFLASNPTRN